MKKVILLVLIILIGLSPHTTMASRGGLSKREVAASKAGGTLNYKTGKISQPVKKAPVRSVAKSSTGGFSSNKVAIASNADGTVRYSDGTSSNPYASNVGESAGIVEARANAQASGVLPKSAPKKSSSNKSSNSSSKPKVLNYTPANGTVKGVENGQAITKTGRALQIANDAFGLGRVGVKPLSEQIKDKLGLSGVDITGMIPGFDSLIRTPVAEASYDPEAIANSNIFQLTRDIAAGSPQTTNEPAPFSPVGDTTSNQNQNFTPNVPASFERSTRIPRASSNQISPYQAPQASFNRPQASFNPVPDTTPVQQNTPGTVRQFLGNGLLSSGQYGNGRGNYGIEGALNVEGFSLQDEINKLLGISTANAAGIQPAQQDFSSQFQHPTIPGADLADPFGINSQDFSSNISSNLSSQGGQSGGGTQISQFMGSGNETSTQTAPAPQQKNNGGVAQQYANSGQNPLQDYYKQQSKGFTAQEKAQKKALNELLKSIKNQYKTSQTEGINNLEKSKQEDLLKLSGLFSFANQDPNSEQRIQYEQRANQDYATQQSKFLSDLAHSRSQEISQAKQGYQGKLADIAQQRGSAQEKLAQLLYQAQQDQQALQAKNSGGGRTYRDASKQIGVNAQGEPVYMDFNTGKQFVASGLKSTYDPYAKFFQQGQQSQSQVQYDENGRPYIEQ